jgi:anti-sigma B factor antagonist
MQMHVVGSNGIVLSPEGCLDASYGLKLESQLISIINTHRNPPLFINFERVESIDSAGLMTLVSAIQLSQRYDFDLTLCAMPPSLKMVLELSQLDQVVTLIDCIPTMAPMAAAA